MTKDELMAQIVVSVLSIITVDSVEVIKGGYEPPFLPGYTLYVRFNNFKKYIRYRFDPEMEVLGNYDVALVIKQMFEKEIEASMRYVTIAEGDKLKNMHTGTWETVIEIRDNMYKNRKMKTYRFSDGQMFTEEQIREHWIKL